MTVSPQPIHDPYRGAPIAVIGAGPVGQTAALLLARWGLPVVLLEATTSRDAVGSKSICQQRDVLDIWTTVGAGQIAVEGLTWRTARTFYNERELSSWSFVDHGHSPLPPFVNISQTRTEEILDERIAETPLIRYQRGHTVVAIDQDLDGVTLTCDTVDGRTRVRAAYVIACSGARGDAVRRSLGVTFEGQSFNDQFLICDIRVPLPEWEHERRFYFDPPWNPGRQVLIHPCPHSTFRIDWQVPPTFHLDDEESSGRLDQRIRAITGDLPYELLWRSVYRFHSRCVPRMRVGRVLLAGDAAHLFAPFGARGLNSGVADAENAAWKLAFVARGWAPQELLESYHAERHAAALENLAVTSATMTFLAPPDDAARQARAEVLQRALVDPQARAAVDSGRLAEPFWYVDSPLITVDATRPFPGRPPKGHPPPAAPGIICPDAPIALADRSEVGWLRQVSRDGLLALVADGIDAGAVATALKNATLAPVRAAALREIDASGELTAALQARCMEVWLVRPDAYIAAVLTNPGSSDVLRAARRALGFPDR